MLREIEFINVEMGCLEMETLLSERWNWLLSWLYIRISLSCNVLVWKPGKIVEKSVVIELRAERA